MEHAEEDGKRSAAIAEALEALLDRFEDRVDVALERANDVVKRTLAALGLRKRRDNAEDDGHFAARRTERRTRTHWLTSVAASVAADVKANHSLLSLCYGDPSNQRRAEVVQMFWSVLMLELMIGAMLFSAPEGSGLTPPYQGSFELMPFVLTFLNTALISLPYLFLVDGVLAWANARRGTVLARLFRGLRAHINAELARAGQTEGGARGSRGSGKQGEAASSVDGHMRTAVASSRIIPLPPGTLRASEQPTCAPEPAPPPPQPVTAATNDRVPQRKSNALKLGGGDITVTLRAVFDRYDVDDVGGLRPEDVGRMVRHFVNKSLNAEDLPSLAKELTVIDVNENQAVSFKEFAQWYIAALDEAVALDKLRHSGWRRFVFAAHNAQLPLWVYQCVGWGVLWILFAITASITLIYGTVLGNDNVRFMLLSCLIAFGQTYGLEEPLSIAVSTAVPLLFAAFQAWIVGLAVVKAAGTRRKRPSGHRGVAEVHAASDAAGSARRVSSTPQGDGNDHTAEPSTTAKGIRASLYLNGGRESPSARRAAQVLVPLRHQAPPPQAQ
jgi:hypothetical protein